MCTIAKLSNPLKTKENRVALRGHKVKPVVEFDKNIMHLIRRA